MGFLLTFVSFLFSSTVLVSFHLLAVDFCPYFLNLHELSGYVAGMVLI